MIFLFFISIVFIAELIIAFTVFNSLFKLDIKINKLSEALINKRADIKDITALAKAISEQLKELSEEFVDNFNEKKEEIILSLVKSLMSTILFWSINIKVVKRLRKSKVLNVAWKGLSLLENVI